MSHIKLSETQLMHVRVLARYIEELKNRLDQLRQMESQSAFLLETLFDTMRYAKEHNIVIDEEGMATRKKVIARFEDVLKNAQADGDHVEDSITFIHEAMTLYLLKECNLFSMQDYYLDIEKGMVMYEGDHEIDSGESP